MSVFRDFDKLEVIAPNFKRRLSGVTSTIIQLVPAQRAAGLEIATFGEGLPASLPHIRYRDLWRLWKRPSSGKKRVWHARRNVEMFAGLLLRDVCRMPLKLLFTSASQRNHLRFTKWLIRRMDHVIATSQKTAAYLDVPHDVVMHGIDLRRFSPPSNRREAKHSVGLPQDKFVIGCFGRIRAQKGTDLFVDSMLPLLSKHDDWIAIIAGRTTAEHTQFEKDLRDKIAAAGLTERLKFVGEHTDIERWYRALDLFIAPQRWEGFGLTPLEAMACGVPVIATDVGAFSELIVPSETGFILDGFAVEEFAAKTNEMLIDDDLRFAMGDKARKHVEDQFSLQTEASKLIAVYRRLID